MKPVNPSVYRAALDRIDVYERALKTISTELGDDLDLFYENATRIAREALETVADADKWDSGSADAGSEKLKAEDYEDTYPFPFDPANPGKRRA